MIGTTEILIICGVVLVLFGAAAIPRFARSLGRARKEFEEGLKEGTKDTSIPGKKDREEKRKD